MIEPLIEFVDAPEDDGVIVCPTCEGDGMDKTGRQCCRKCDGYSLLKDGKPYKE